MIESIHAVAAPGGGVRRRWLWFVAALGLATLVLAGAGARSATAATAPAPGPYLYWNVQNDTICGSLPICGSIGRRSVGASANGSDDTDPIAAHTSLEAGDYAGLAASPKNVYWTARTPPGYGKLELISASVDDFGAPPLGPYHVDGVSMAVDHTYVYSSSPSRDLGHVGGISMAVDDKYVYWAGTINSDGAAVESSFIGRAKLDGSDVQAQFLAVPGGALSVAVYGDQIYWTDPDHNRVGRANVNGTDVNPDFISSEPAWGIAVNGQHIYLTSSVTERIDWANLDGSGLRPLILNPDTHSPGLYKLEGITADADHIYWAEPYQCTPICAGGFVGRADLDGTHVEPEFVHSIPSCTKSTERPAGVSSDFSGMRCTGVPSLFFFNPAVPGCLRVDGSTPAPPPGTLSCGPTSVAVSPPTQPICMRGSERMPAPSGGAVFARPEGASGANIVVLPPGASWTGPDSCTGIAQGSEEVMSHPGWVSVSRDAAVELHDQPAGLVSAWGARDAGQDGHDPVLFPGKADWETTEASIVSPESLFESFHGCPSCELPDGVTVPAVAKDPEVAYQGDLSDAVMRGAKFTGPIAGWDVSGAQLQGAELDGTFDGWNAAGAQLQGAELHGAFAGWSAARADLQGAELQGAFAGWSAARADLQGAKLSGDFAGWDSDFVDLRGAEVSGNLTGWNLSGVSLEDAKFSHVDVSGVRFDEADLHGAQLDSLTYGDELPSFFLVRLGWVGGVCTTIKDTDLVNVGFDSSSPGPRCEGTPLLPGSTVNLHFVFRTRQRVDFSGARILATASDRSELAGVDLAGVHLDAARFVGFPVDLKGTDFDGASLEGTNFSLGDLAKARFVGADLSRASFERANLTGADFSGEATNLRGASFVQADVSGATFARADISGAVFNGVLARDTDFRSVNADATRFVGAHIYGDGQAFRDPGDGAVMDMARVDFSGAVLAGGDRGEGGFDLTNADLANASFDGAQCVGCDFTDSTLTGANFSDSYLPGVDLEDAFSLLHASFSGAWLYCGALDNSLCDHLPGDPGSGWSWPLELGSGESYGPVPFKDTKVSESTLSTASTCPFGTAPDPDPTVGCEPAGGTLMLPNPSTETPPIPPPCSAVAQDACPTTTSTVYDTGAAGKVLAVAAATPATWATTVNRAGYYVALSDGTVRLVGLDANPLDSRIVAGRPGEHCSTAESACGDGGQATDAVLGTPSGVAVGLDGSVYIADSALHRVRRVDPSGKITTVAGDGKVCAGAGRPCGDGGAATKAQLAAADGVWVAPSGDVFIADGPRGIREVSPAGKIRTITVGPHGGDVVSVTGDADNDLYAATNDPDHLVKINRANGAATVVAGTGVSGYNGNRGADGRLLPATEVQLNGPRGLTVGLDGQIVFADSANNLIRAYDPSSGTVTDDIAGVVDGGVPQGGFNGDGQFADQTELDDPQAVTAIGQASYVIADTNNNKVREIGPGPAGAPSDPAPKPLKNRRRTDG